MSMILVVCTGNVCRSPLAEATLRKQPGLDGLTIRSAGTGVVPEHPMCERALAILANSGDPAVHHRPRALTPGLLENADLVLVAAYEHRAAVALMRPTARRKTFTLKEACVFIRSMVAEHPFNRQGEPGALEERVDSMVRRMNDMRGAGKLTGRQTPRTLFTRPSSSFVAHAEIADGHWGTERAHRKTLKEVAVISQAIGAGLADLLGAPH